MLDQGDFDANLAAVTGEDYSLRSELLVCFQESLAAHVNMLGRARCDGNWRLTAMRIRELAAGFHCSELSKLAEDALDAAPGDPVILRRLGSFSADFSNRI